jgi:DNA-binding transcriptional regulator GbsR (MarR family)
MLVHKESSEQFTEDTPVRSPSLSSVEIEIIDLFAVAARVLGQPRSVAEIYGLLFVSAEPLALDDIIERLRLSRGSASQGLKYLRDLGAVRTVYVPQNRRTHYEAVAELRKLAGQFLRIQIQPTLEESEQRLQHIREAIAHLPDAQRAHVERRIDTLHAWGENTRRLLPVILKVLGG